MGMRAPWPPALLTQPLAPHRFFILANAAAEMLLWRATAKDQAAANTKGGPVGDGPAAGSGTA